MRRASSLGILFTGVLFVAAGCSDDDDKLESLCASGRCSPSGGSTSMGGSPVGTGGATAVGGTSEVAGGSTSTGGSVAVGGVAGATRPVNDTGAAGATPSGGATSTAGSSSLAGATNTAGTTSLAGSANTAGGTSAAGSPNIAGANTGIGGTTDAGGADNVAGATSNTGGTSGGGGAAGNTGDAGTAGVAGAAGPPPFVPGTAILKYDFEDGTGTQVTDLSGSGNHGVLAGADWTLNTEGRNGIAANFAVADAAVALPNDLFSTAKGLTVSAWVMLTANAQGNRLFDFGSGLGNHIYLVFNGQDTGGLELGVEIGAGSPRMLYANSTLPLNVWKHVTVVLASSGAHLYVDGWEVARDSTLIVSPSALGTTNSNWIGKWAVPENTFTGRIDEFYVYDNEIALADIRQLAWPKRDYSIWHFDETSGAQAADSSDNHRDATMVRATFNTGVVGNAAQLYNPSNDDTPPADADQYVQLPTGVVQDCTAGYTVAAWIQLIAVRTHARVFEFSNNTSTCILGRTMGGMTQQWALGDASSGNVQYASIDYTWPLGTWHHVAAVRDGLILHTYIDGHESGSKTPFTMPADTPPASSLGNSLYNYIGRTRDSAASNERRRLHGFVDEFLLSCRPYTSDEVKQLAARF